MNIPASLRIAALGFALTSIALAQTPPPTPPTPPADGPPSLPIAPATTSQLPLSPSPLVSALSIQDQAERYAVSTFGMAVSLT